DRQAGAHQATADDQHVMGRGAVRGRGKVGHCAMLTLLPACSQTLMNRPVASSIFAPGPLVLAALIVLAALTRVLPHPPNFSPVAAIALFGGAYFANRSWALIVPLAGLFVSDLVLSSMHGGLYAQWFSGAGIWLVYGCIALTTLMGF